MLIPHFQHSFDRRFSLFFETLKPKRHKENSFLPCDSVLDPFFMADSILLPLELFLLQEEEKNNPSLELRNKQK